MLEGDKEILTQINSRFSSYFLEKAQEPPSPTPERKWVQDVPRIQSKARGLKLAGWADDLDWLRAKRWSLKKLFWKQVRALEILFLQQKRKGLTRQPQSTERRARQRGDLDPTSCLWFFQKSLHACCSCNSVCLAPLPCHLIFPRKHKKIASLQKAVVANNFTHPQRFVPWQWLQWTPDKPAITSVWTGE